MRIELKVGAVFNIAPGGDLESSLDCHESKIGEDTRCASTAVGCEQQLWMMTDVDLIRH